MQLTVTTWNLKGHDGPDTDAVVDHVRAVGADLVALQEVQRSQAREVARGLGAASLRWGFKHWPVTVPAEGLAVIGVTRPARVRTRALTFRFRYWSWRRRVYQVAAVGVDVAAGTGGVSAGSNGFSAGSGEAGGGPGPALVLANAHLSPHGEEERREREASTIVRALAAFPTPTVVVGDLNDDPGSRVIARFREAGYRDAWAEAHPGTDGFTNWHGWERGTTKPPNRRIDYVLVGPGPDIVRVDVPRYGTDGFARFPTISDHLPITATLDLG